MFSSKYSYRNESSHFASKDASPCHSSSVIWRKDMFSFGSPSGYNTTVFSLVTLALRNCSIVSTLRPSAPTIFMTSRLLLAFESDFEMPNRRAMSSTLLPMYGLICCHRNSESVWFDGIGKLYSSIRLTKARSAIDVMKDDLKLNARIRALPEPAGAGASLILEAFAPFVHAAR